MRNQDRLPAPYQIARCISGTVTAGDIQIGTVADTTDSSCVVVRTNGGTLIALPSGGIDTPAPTPPSPDPGT